MQARKPRPAHPILRQRGREQRALHREGTAEDRPALAPVPAASPPGEVRTRATRPFNYLALTSCRGEAEHRRTHWHNNRQRLGGSDHHRSMGHHKETKGTRKRTPDTTADRLQARRTTSPSLSACSPACSSCPRLPRAAARLSTATCVSHGALHSGLEEMISSSCTFAPSLTCPWASLAFKGVAIGNRTLILL
jgi:hypothetical protein